MKISDIRITKLKPTKKNKTLKAFVSFVIDKEFCITGVKVVDGENGLFVAFPTRLGEDENGKEKYYDVCYPITKEAREGITSAILKEYEE